MKYYLNKIHSKGFLAFTLIELLVAISILAMVAAISVSSYPQFSEQMGVSSENLKVLAYMREAQVYGSSGYTDSGVKVVYGLHLDRNSKTIKRVQWQNPTGLTNQNYVDNSTSAPEADLIVSDKFEIDKICSIQSGVDSCDSNPSYDDLFVFFKRPNPEARIIGRVGSIIYPSQSGTTGLPRAEVHIRSKLNTEFSKKIVILQTGQMYVE